MSEHESIRQLLALSAAGLLDADEERRVRQHAGECAECAGELDEFAALTAGLAAMPAPRPPVYLLSRTTALMAAEADRREGEMLAGAVAILALVFVLLMGQALRAWLGDSAAWAWLGWAVISSVLGTGAALMLASRRRLERRLV